MADDVGPNLGPAYLPLSNLVSGRDATLTLPMTVANGDPYSTTSINLHFYTLDPMETVAGAVAAG